MRTKLLFLSMLVALAGGCSTLYEVRFPVDPSVTDQAYLTYHAVTLNGETAPVVTRLDVSGSGHLLLKRGRSERVQNSYWREPYGENWRDIQSDQLVLTRDETTACFQALVDAGFLDRRRGPPPLLQAGSPYLSIVAIIDGRKGYIVTSDPVYLSVFRDLLARFR